MNMKLKCFVNVILPITCKLFLFLYHKLVCLELRQREMDRERQKMEWEMKERQAEEQRLREGDIFRRQNDDLSMRMHHQDEEMRRRQDGSSFMQVCLKLI